MEHILEEFYELVQIPAPSLGEREMADALKQKLGELGFFVTEDDAGEKTGGNAGKRDACRCVSYGFGSSEGQKTQYMV